MEPGVLAVSEEAGGRRLTWVPRVRTGDGWDLEPAEVDPRRFRVRVLDGDVQRREFEVEGLALLYPAEDMAADFPDGVGPDAAVLSRAVWPRLRVGRGGAGFVDRLKNIAPHTACLN